MVSQSICGINHGHNATFTSCLNISQGACHHKALLAERKQRQGSESPIWRQQEDKIYRNLLITSRRFAFHRKGLRMTTEHNAYCLNSDILQILVSSSNCRQCKHLEEVQKIHFWYSPSAACPPQIFRAERHMPTDLWFKFTACQTLLKSPMSSALTWSPPK